MRGFRALVGTYVVNELGNWLGEIALAILVFDQTGSPVATAALFLAMQFLPAFLAPVLVSRLEAMPASRSLPLLYGLEAVAFTALALLSQEFVLAAVLVLAAFDGAVAASARALTRASAGALLTSPGLLREGNAVMNFGFTICAALGPLFGGLVVAGAGVEAALWADALSFAVVAFVLAADRGIPRVEIEAARIADRLRDGYRYVRDRPALARLLTAESAAFVFFYAAIPIEVVFAKETLDAGDAGYGLLLSSWGAGMVAGGLVFALLRRLTLRVLLAASTLAIGLAYLGMGAAPTLAIACAAAVIGGVGNGMQWVAMVSAVQEMTDLRYQARVMAMMESISSATPGIGFILGGAVAALLSPRASFALAGFGVLLVLVAAAIALTRVGWRGDKPPPEDIDEPLAAPAEGIDPDALPGGADPFTVNRQ
jgi:predicted MFS family arabinose efflux permease